MIDRTNENKRNENSNTSDDDDSLNEDPTSKTDGDTTTAIRIKSGEIIGV